MAQHSSSVFTRKGDCMKVTALFALLILLLGWGTESLAQFVPVIAKQRSIHYLRQSDGSETEVIRTEGTYFRSSSGSVLDTMMQVKGDRKGKHESVHRDSSTKKIYLLNHNLEKATLKQVSRKPFRPVELKPSLAVGKGVIQGLDCMAMRVVHPHNRDASIGKIWWARGAKVRVKSEQILGRERIVRELYDIEFAEPDSSVFRFPANYKIDDSEWNWRRRELRPDEANRK